VVHLLILKNPVNPAEVRTHFKNGFRSRRNGLEAKKAKRAKKGKKARIFAFFALFASFASRCIPIQEVVSVNVS